MAANDIPALSTSNTFGQLLVSTNALIKQANLLNSGIYVKEGGDLRVLDGAISLEKTSGTTLTVASDATFGGTISSKTIINSGDITVQGQNALFSNTTGTVTVRNNLVSSNVFANNITSNAQVTAQNVSVAGYLLATGSNLDAAPTITAFGEKAAVNIANRMLVSNSGNVDVQGTMLVSRTSGLALNVRSNAIFAGEVAVRSALPILNVSSSGQVAILQIQSTTGTTDNNVWHLRTVDSSGKLRLQAQTDALTGGGSVLDINRNAQQITGIDLSVSSSNDALRITQTGSGRAFVVEDETNPDGTPFVIDAGGNVGIGTTATTFAKMALRRDSSRPDAEYGLYSTFRSSSTSGSNNKFAIQGDVGTSAGYTGTHVLTAVSGIGSHETTGTITQLRGVSAYLQSIGSGTITNAYQFLAQEAGLGAGGSNTITNLVGYWAGDMSSGTNNYAFYSNLSAAPNKWGFYSGGTANSFFNGSLGLGTTTELNSYKLNVLGDSKITGNVVVVNTTAGDALRITQTGTGRAFVVEDETNPDSTPFVIDANGYIGIGTVTIPTTKQYLIHQASSTTSAEYGIFGDTRTSAASGSTDKFGIIGLTRTQSGYGGTGVLVGVAGQTQHSVTGNVLNARAFSSYIQSSAADGSANITNAIQYFAQDAGLGAGGSNTIANLYGFFTADLTAGATDIGFGSAVSAGANKWNFHASGTANNYFNGSVGIGITGPTSKLHVVGDANVTTSLTVAGMNVTQTIVNAYGQANLAYTQANTATTTAQSAYGQANLAYTQANTGVNAAIAAYGQANLAYATANAAYGQANLAYTQANTGTTTAQSAYGQANLAYAAANAAPAAAYAQANLAYARANTAANTTRVSVNRGSIQNAVALNFNNTANIIVTVGAGAAGDANVSFDLPSTLPSLSVTSLSATSLTVTNPIIAPSESDSASYRLRVSQTTRGDGTFGVNQGGANGNAEIKFVSSPGVWQLTSNNLTGTYYTIISSQNVSDSVSTTSSANVASLTAVKTAYDQATNAYNTANSSAATVRVTAGASTLANKQLNFVNTATITVSVVDSGTGNANISFTSTVSGGVTSVGTGIGLTGGPIAGSGTISANIASTTVQGVTKLVDATNSNDTANAATAAAVKTAYDQATNAYNAANTSANTIAIYANNSLILSKAPINFNNSSSVRVFAQANGTSFTNVSFGVIGGAGSGLDADLLDGLNSTSFIRSDANTTGNIGLSGVSPYIRLESNDLDVFLDQEIASIVFSTVDASIGGSGDKGKITATAEGTSGGAALNFFSAVDGGSAKLGASLRGNNDLRLYSSDGTSGNFHSIRSQATTLSSLTLPSGDVTLKVGVAANVTELGFAYNQANLAYAQANTGTTTAQNAYGQANLAYTRANTGVNTAIAAYGQANLAYTQANTGTTVAQAAYTQANTGTTTAQVAYGQANLAYTQANTGTTVAQAAYVKANAAANTAQVSVNSASIISSAAINFVNTPTVSVSVTSGGAGVANISLTSLTLGGTVTQVNTGIGLAGGGFTTSGTISANIASTTVQGVTKLIDSVTTNDAANAATGAAVKTAYDQASLAYAQANTALNKTQVSVNGGSVQSNVGVNFNNTSTVQVTVGAGTAGNANVSFAVTPTFNSQVLTTADVYAAGGLFVGSAVSNTTISTSAITIRSNIANQGNATVELVASGTGSGISYLELGANGANFIDFKTPYTDDFDYRIYADRSSGMTIYAGSATASPNVLNIVSGNVNIDNGAFFFDANANRFGINNPTPTANLDVVGDGKVSGNFRIGNGAFLYDASVLGLSINKFGSAGAPTTALDVFGDVKITSGPVTINSSDTADGLKVIQSDTGTANVLSAINGTTKGIVIDNDGRMKISAGPGGAFNLFNSTINGKTFTQTGYTSTASAGNPAIWVAGNQPGAASILLGHYEATIASNKGGLTIHRSRGFANGTLGALLTSDVIGAIDFTGDTGSNVNCAASIVATCQGVGAGFVSGSLDFRTSQNNVAPQTRMRIANTGNVGINLGAGVNPSYTLHVSGSSYVGGTSTIDGGTLANTANSTADAFSVYAGTGNGLSLKTGFVRRADGNTWTTAAARIQSVVDVTWQSYIDFNGNNNDAGLSFGTGTSTVNGNQVPERMRIANTGIVTINNLSGAGSRTVTADATGALSAASDASLKKEVPEANIPGLNEIVQVQPKAYKWLSAGDNAPVEIGFFANQVAPIIPSAAPMGDDGLYGFYDRSMIAALVKSVQELKDIVDAQAIEISYLKTRVKTLEGS